jgi:hypothetical protein
MGRTAPGAVEADRSRHIERGISRYQGILMGDTHRRQCATLLTTLRSAGSCVLRANSQLPHRVTRSGDNGSRRLAKHSFASIQSH